MKFKEYHPFFFDLNPTQQKLNTIYYFSKYSFLKNKPKQQMNEIIEKLICESKGVLNFS